MIDPEKISDKFDKNIEKNKEISNSNFISTSAFEQKIKHLNQSSTDFLWFIITLQLINLFGSKDPSPIHFTAAREYLKKQDVESDKAVDSLARFLVIACQNFREYMLKKFTVNNTSIVIENKVVATLSTTNEWIIIGDSDYPDFKCSQDECNAVDIAFSEFLETIGPYGKEASNIIKESSPKRYYNYIQSGYSPEYRQESWSVWISKDHLSVSSPFLNVLVNVTWNDKCRQRWEKEKHNIPAITQAVLVKTIKPPLTKDMKIEITNDTMITCYSADGNIISRVPCVDPKLVKLICKGMKSLSSLNGHKLIRWQVKTGFFGWASGASDPRLISTSGGYEGIADLIGSGKSNKSITEVKALLHAQAYGQFEFPQGGAGNMIILREIEKYRNGEPSKINIILGEFLLPNFTHLLPQGEKRRLVPITELPPLIGSTNTHAAQAMLQLLLLEEFTRQSDRLSTNGSILLPMEKWEELAFQAKLPKTSLYKVIMGWTEEDLFSKAFLQKSGDEYTLGQEHSNVIEFLEYQGKQRINGAKGGEKSASSKKGLVKRKYSKNEKISSQAIDLLS